MIGIASGTYSSIFIATPVLQHWKEREPGFRARHARILETLGYVPPYATAAQGGPVDVTPKEAGGRRRSISAPPGQEVSASEFQEMVRELDVEAGKPEPPARGDGRVEPPGRRPAGTRPRQRRSRAAGGTPVIDVRQR